MKRYRLFVLPALGLIVILGWFLVSNLSNNLVYYRTPAEVMDPTLDVGDRRFRLGGQVVPGTINETGEVVSFEVTDGLRSVAVRHRGTPQQLFREGIGVVLEGTWDGTLFSSDTMIIKHDEQYRTEDGSVYTPDARFPDS